MENLFHWSNNRRKDDEELLPNEIRNLLGIRLKPKKPDPDWTREKYHLKLAQIRRMVEEMGSPDILSVVEIEGGLSAVDLRDALGYHNFLITNSIDGRGVNVALFFKESVGLTLISHSELDVVGEETSTHPTRSILEAEFHVNGKHRLFVHVNHWPSQMGPATARMRAAHTLRGRVEELAETVPGAYFVATGDFNVIDEASESPHAIQYLEKKGAYVDVGQSLAARGELPTWPPGTYYYAPKKQWNRLDRFLVSAPMANRRLRSGLIADTSTFRIVAPDFLAHEVEVKGGGTEWVPIPYDHNASAADAAGFSDHFPIVMSLRDLSYGKP